MVMIYLGCINQSKMSCLNIILLDEHPVVLCTEDLYAIIRNGRLLPKPSGCLQQTKRAFLHSLSGSVVPLNRFHQAVALEVLFSFC